jgi:CubicO group peptidase (beta-lactamase class C family)
MTTTRIISEADIVPNRAAGYRLDNAALKNQEWVAPLLNTTADGALYLSVLDMIAWDAGLRRKAILKPESWNLVFQPVRLNSGKTYPYGFGWFLDERNGQPLQEHSGAWQGFTSWFSRYLGDDLSIIALTNLADADPGRFVNGIAEILNPNLALNIRPIVDQEPGLTARFAKLLDNARSGSLDPEEFAPLLARGIEKSAGALKEEWGALGKPKGLVLVKRDERGDDRIFLYEVTFPAHTKYFQVAIGPDDRITQFHLFEK